MVKSKIFDNILGRLYPIIQIYFITIIPTTMTCLVYIKTHCGKYLFNLIQLYNFLAWKIYTTPKYILLY